MLILYNIISRYKELVRQGKYVPRSARASLLSGYSSTTLPISEANEVSLGSENGPVVRGAAATTTTTMAATELGEDIASRLTDASTAGILSSSHQQQQLDTRYRDQTRICEGPRTDHRWPPDSTCFCFWQAVRRCLFL